MKNEPTKILIKYVGVHQLTPNYDLVKRIFMVSIVYHQVFYPGFFDLPLHDWYLFNFKKMQVAFYIASHPQPLHAIDFSKKLSENETISFDCSRSSQSTITYTTVTRDERKLTNSGKLLVDIEIPSLGFSRYYSEIMLCHELNSKTEISYDHNEILGKVVEAYRLASGDYKIPLQNECRSDFPLVRKAVKTLTKDEEKLPINERLTLIPGTLKLELCTLKAFDRFASSPNDIAVPTHELDSRVRSFLSDNISSRSKEYFSMLGLAISAFVSENYKSSFLECFMLLEVITSDFLINKKILAGV